jgi:hypothetical protein
MQFLQSFEQQAEDLVCRLCQMIVTAGAGERRGRGSELADAILEQLPNRRLDDETIEQLSRWCNMANREPEVEGHFRQISRILFGRSTGAGGHVTRSGMKRRPPPCRTHLLATELSPDRGLPIIDPPAASS